MVPPAVLNWPLAQSKAWGKCLKMCCLNAKCPKQCRIAICWPVMGNIRSTQLQNCFNGVLERLSWDGLPRSKERFVFDSIIRLSYQIQVSIIPGVKEQLESPPINAHFKINQLAVSGLKVNRLDMHGEAYKPFKGVKYITKAGKFQVRTIWNSIYYFCIFIKLYCVNKCKYNKYMRSFWDQNTWWHILAKPSQCFQNIQPRVCACLKNPPMMFLYLIQA